MHAKGNDQQVDPVVCGLVGGVIGAGLTALVGWAGWEALAATVDSLADIVTAVAALLALTLWKRQLRGSSRHESAKRLLMAAYELEDAIADSLVVTKTFTSQPHSTRERVGLRVLDAQATLRAAIDSSRAARRDARRFWDRAGTDASRDLESLAIDWHGGVDWYLTVMLNTHAEPTDDSGWKWGAAFRGEPDVVAALRAKVEAGTERVVSFVEPYVH